MRLPCSKSSSINLTSGSGISFPPLFGQLAAIVAFDSLRRFLPNNNKEGQENEAVPD